jgi:transposase
MKVRVVQVSAEESPSGRAEMWIATRNRKDAERVQRKLRKQEQKVKAILAKVEEKKKAEAPKVEEKKAEAPKVEEKKAEAPKVEEKKAEAPKVEEKKLEEHSEEVTNLLGHRALKRLVTKAEDGTLVLNRAYLREERLLAGIHVLRTTLVDRDPIEVLDAYQALLKVEDNFRTFKGPLRLRPMYHRLAHRIEAHTTMCVLAMIMVRVLEQRTGLSYRQLVEIFSPVKATLTEQGDTQFWQRNEWDSKAEAVLAALGIDPGARAWGATQVKEHGS